MHEICWIRQDGPLEKAGMVNFINRTYVDNNIRAHLLCFEYFINPEIVNDLGQELYDTYELIFIVAFDKILPDINGIQFATMLVQDFPEIKNRIVLFSADPDLEIEYYTEQKTIQESMQDLTWLMSDGNVALANLKKFINDYFRKK